MLSIALVTPVYVEMGSPAGLCTAVLAQAFAERGHDVHVVCSASTAPRSQHVCNGSLTIHRLNTRRGSPEQAFAIQACRYILDLSRAGKCDAIECIDAPSCLLGAAALRQTGALDATLVSVAVDPELHSLSQKTTITCIADANVRVDHAGMLRNIHHIPFPLMPDVWHPPRTGCPTFIACDATTNASQQLIISAFKRSIACEQGWSLAVMSTDGRWFILPGTAQAETERTDRQVVISVSRAAPVAPVHALRRGDLCIFSDHSPLTNDLRDPFPHLMFHESDPDSLATAMHAAVDLSESEHADRSLAISTTLASRHQSDAVVDAHEHVWSMPSTAINLRERTAMWRELESRASTVG